MRLAFTQNCCAELWLRFVVLQNVTSVKQLENKVIYLIRCFSAVLTNATPFFHSLARWTTTALSLSPSRSLSQGGGANFEWCVYKQQQTNPTHSGFEEPNSTSTAFCDGLVLTVQGSRVDLYINIVMSLIVIYISLYRKYIYITINDITI